MFSFSRIGAEVLADNPSYNTNEKCSDSTGVIVSGTDPAASSLHDVFKKRRRIIKKVFAVARRFISFNDSN